MTSRIRLAMAGDAVGGVWTYMVEAARALQPLGIDVLLLVMGPSPSVEQQQLARAVPGLLLVDTGLPLDWLADDEAALSDAATVLSRLAVQHRADLIQLNMPALAAFARWPVPVIAAAHSCVATWWAATGGGALPETLAWRAALMRRGMEAADAVVAPSASFARALAATYRSARPIEIVHNGRTPLLRRSGVGHDCVFTAGRLWDRGKDVSLLDRVAGRLAVPFHAAGPVSAANGEQIALDHLHLLGILDEAALGRWLACRPVFVSAARYEPFGLAVLEAAQAGCALVLSDIPTFRELWDDVAIFVPVGDEAGFEAAVAGLIGDARGRLTAGDAARRRARRYAPSVMAAGLHALYRRALAADSAKKAAA